jgi:hypothetical protein
VCSRRTLSIAVAGTEQKPGRELRPHTSQAKPVLLHRPLVKRSMRGKRLALVSEIAGEQKKNFPTWGEIGFKLPDGTRIAFRPPAAPRIPARASVLPGA